MNNQNLEIENLTVEMLFLIENKMIMKYIEQYMKEKDMDDAVFNQINHVRLCKEMIISTELVRARGEEKTNACNKLEKKSLLKQKFNILKAKQEASTVVKAWNKFKE